MTEKRFNYWKDGTWEQINDESTANNFYTLEQCANELNRLNKENEQLKQRITTQSVDREQLCKRIDEVRKENEQLKQQLIEKERMLDVVLK